MPNEAEVGLEGTKVEISRVTGHGPQRRLQTDAVKPGLLLGVAKITVNTTPGD